MHAAPRSVARGGIQHVSGARSTQQEDGRSGFGIAMQHHYAAAAAAAAEAKDGQGFLIPLRQMHTLSGRRWIVSDARMAPGGARRDATSRVVIEMYPSTVPTAPLSCRVSQWSPSVRSAVAPKRHQGRRTPVKRDSDQVSHAVAHGAEHTGFKLRDSYRRVDSETHNALGAADQPV